MAETNFYPVQPIIKAVETVGENPWSKTRTKHLGAENYNKIYMKLTTKRKHLLKTQEKPNSEKNQKYQFRRRCTRESPSAVKAFNDP